jgi:hypothetical protein
MATQARCFKQGANVLLIRQIRAQGRRRQFAEIQFFEVPEIGR